MGKGDSQRFNKSFEYLPVETPVPKFIKKKMIDEDVFFFFCIIIEKPKLYNFLLSSFFLPYRLPGQSHFLAIWLGEHGTHHAAG